MLNSIEKFKVAILHMKRERNHCFVCLLDGVVLFMQLDPTAAFSNDVGLSHG